MISFLAISQCIAAIAVFWGGYCLAGASAVAGLFLTGVGVTWLGASNAFCLSALGRYRNE